MKILYILFFLLLTLSADIGKITMLKGSANITRGSEILDAKAGLLLEEKDIIIIDKKSRVQVILNDETIITLGSKTKYTFNSYSDKKENAHTRMSLARGYMRVITGRIGKIAPERFKVKTAEATIGIRGTGWETFIGHNIENSVCFKGAITITTQNGEFELPAGNMLLITNGNAKKYKTNMKFFNAQIKKTKKDTENTPPDAELSIEDEAPLEDISEKITEATKDIESEIINNPDFGGIGTDTLTDPPANDSGDPTSGP